MIKDNQKSLNRYHIVMDGLIIIVSYVLAWFIIYMGAATKGDGMLPAWFYFNALYLIVPEFLVLYGIFHLYTPKRVQGKRMEFANIVKANIIGILIITMVLYLGSKSQWLNNFSRQLVFFFMCFNIVLETTVRFCLRMALRSMRSKGYNQKHVLLVGYSRAAMSYIDKVLANPEWGYQIQGILDDFTPKGSEYKGIQVMGDVSDLAHILSMNLMDEITITLSLHHYDKLESIVAACEKSGVHTKFIPDYNNIIPTKPYTEDLQGLPVVHIRRVPLANLFNSSLKRGVDIAGATFGLLVFSPLMLLVALAIKISSPGPVLFSQERVGLHNRSFKMYKFRSMEVQAPSKEKKEWTKPNDPRVTGVGRFIRKTSIDEFPQFYNVLMGDMSLVGPRPERPFFVEKFKEEIPRYMVKHQVRPGLTGWAQVNGYRGDTSITKRIEHDLYYIENWTMGFDFKIMFLTVFKGFINKNAY